MPRPTPRTPSHPTWVLVALCCANVSCADLLGVGDLTFAASVDDETRGGTGGVPVTGGTGGTAAGGTGGTSGTGTTGGTSPGGNPTCAGRASPVPVNIEGRFCIDSTEVTNAQYSQFLASGPPPPTDAACAWNFDYTPSDGWPAGNPNLPVGYVDWCDARGYCAWAGKRLCGAIGGGPFAFDGFPANRLSTELYYACSRGGDFVFPYGNSYNQTACATESLGSIRPVGTSPGCEGGFPGVFDLSGNAEEWQDSCDSLPIGDEDSRFCQLGSRGIGYPVSGNPPGSYFACGYDNISLRSLVSDDSGIRCCSDAI